MNLGAILHLNGKLKEAESNYLRALQLKPDDLITQSNLHKLWNVMQKQGLWAAGTWSAAVTSADIASVDVWSYLRWISLNIQPLLWTDVG